MDPHFILGAQDTTADTHAVLIALYRKMTPRQRAERIVALWRSAQDLAKAEVRSRRPNLSERELRLRVGSRVISRELMIEAFGWDPASLGY